MHHMQGKRHAAHRGRGMGYGKKGLCAYVGIF